MHVNVKRLGTGERASDYRGSRSGRTHVVYWIHDHLACARLQFFPKLAAFNIDWHERPVRSIYGYIKPTGYVLGPSDSGPSGSADTYKGCTIGILLLS